MNQKDRTLIFDRLRAILSPYEKDLTVKSNFDAWYEVEFDKDYSVTSERTGKTTKKHGLYFAGIIIQSDYVGFYFMPMYAHPKEFADVSPELRKMLKGKSCFHVKKYDEMIFKEIEKIVKKGFQIFKKV